MILACHVADFFKSREKMLPKRGMVGLGVEHFQQLHPLWRRAIFAWLDIFQEVLLSFILFPFISPPFPLVTIAGLPRPLYVAWSHYWNQGSDCLSPNIHIPYMHQKFFLLKTLPINILKKGQQHMSDDKQNGLIMAVNCVLHIYNH